MLAVMTHLEEVLAYQEKAQSELDQLATSDEDSQKLLSEVKILESCVNAVL
jgi:DNA repair ATPase RecN